MTNDEYERRKNLSFAQAEGRVPLPSQLKLGEVDQRMRSVLWARFFAALKDAAKTPHLGPRYIDGNWRNILYRVHIHYFDGMADEFDNDYELILSKYKPIFAKGDYIDILGLLEYLIRDRQQSLTFVNDIASALVDTRSAYRVMDKTIVPVGSPEEAKTIALAFENLETGSLPGAKAHLAAAASALTRGDFAGSVRESVHAVESVARLLEPTADLSKALLRLEASAQIHGGLRKAFIALYGYASDEQGIRHALLDDDQADVDETDALFMMGACAAFVSYLLGKAKAAGL